MEEASKILSKPWQKFLTKMELWKTTPEHDWEPIHLVGYFCFRFNQHYNRKYALSYQGPPSKCTEIVMIKKLYAALDTTVSDPVKDYIDWVFDKVIQPQKLNIRAISFLITNGIVNNYIKFLSEKKKITKNTQLPEEFKPIIEYYEVAASNYGDLQFIKKALDQDSQSESRQPYRKLLEQLCSIGLNLEVLDKL